MDIGHCYTASFSHGDRVQQVAQIGLGFLTSMCYVLAVEDMGEIILSKEADGPPLTDLSGEPRHYPSRKFRKVEL